MAAKSVVCVVVLAVVYGLYQSWNAKPVPDVQGSCIPVFKKVEEAFRAGYKNGLERGSALALYHKGELVCDMWGGWADETSNLPWSKDTVSIVFSTTKAVSAITFALLHERGLFDYEDRVSKHWPEFAQNGKAEITIAQLVSHQAGLAALDEKVSMEDIREHPDKVSKVIEKQKPNWTPGTDVGDHALTFSLMIDQLIRRMDPQNRGLDEYYREEIAEPYGIDFDIGLPYAKQWRSARITQRSDLTHFIDQVTHLPYLKVVFDYIVNKGTLLRRTFSCVEFRPEGFNWPQTRATPLGSAFGSGSARGVAKLFSIVGDPEHHEQALLSDKTLKTMMTSQTGQKRERILGMSISVGMGIFLDTVEGNHVEFHHPGYGGQVGAGIPALHLSWAYITNYPSIYLLSFDDRNVIPLHKAIVNAARKLK